MIRNHTLAHGDPETRLLTGLLLEGTGLGDRMDTDGADAALDLDREVRRHGFQNTLAHEQFEQVSWDAEEDAMVDALERLAGLTQATAREFARDHELEPTAAA